jgi:hypothetical protein
MKLKNEFGDTVEQTDRVMAILNTEQQKNYGYFLSVKQAKRWIERQRNSKCKWHECDG